MCGKNKEDDVNQRVEYNLKQSENWGWKGPNMEYDDGGLIIESKMVDAHSEWLVSLIKWLLSRAD